MANHILEPLKKVPITTATALLSAGHDFIAERCRKWHFPGECENWGIEAKRKLVDLNAPGRPPVVGKEKESFPELINVLAATERMLATLKWFGAAGEFSGFLVHVCHPATSGLKGENDLMLSDHSGNIRVRCEVCDVAASMAGQNNKEKKDLYSLGCEGAVPVDECRRFISTSPEFAKALMSQKRIWKVKFHRYLDVEGTADFNTKIIEVVPVEEHCVLA
jgi:hypothetical protein